MKKIGEDLYQNAGGFLIITGDDKQNKEVISKLTDLLNFATFRWWRLFKR